eukprot:CAMPEP_0204825800 /NCGR_PEP_ID=MMETSP1346-20131115/3605_1 /ASSEMBLY_ACC=CAM_ASM_000771 /TAXON_ID=215587 /ORGANISM="Aplanochytrium stocchinoi, Strain GSBS06" /LENGTH=752 /DNA_ID=CAMNT_0051953543 /DNA_START=497 /DNA_END=2755 /DNA_ORIENTATION=+
MESTIKSKLFKKYEMLSVKDEVSALEKTAWVKEDINLDSAVEYLARAVNFMLGEERGADTHQERKLTRYFAEMSVYAWRNFRQIREETVRRETTLDEVLLAHKLMMIGSFFREIDPKITKMPLVRLKQVGGRKITNEMDQFLDVTSEEQLKSLMEAEIVLQALRMELGKRKKPFVHRLANRKHNKKRSTAVIENKRLNGTNGRNGKIGSGVKRVRHKGSFMGWESSVDTEGNKLTTADARKVIRGVVACARILSVYVGKRLQLMYQDRPVSSDEISDLFEDEFVSKITEKKSKLSSFDISSKRDLAVSASTSGAIEIYSISSKQSAKAITPGVAPGKCPLTLDEQLLFVGDIKGELKVYNLEHDRWMQAIRAHEAPVVALLHYSGRVFSSDTKGFIKAWDIFNTTDNLFLLKGHSGAVTCMAADAGYLISGGVDGTIRFWDVLTKSPSCKSLLQSKHGEVTALHVDGGEIYSGGVDGCIRIWDEDSGNLLYVLQNAHVETVTAITVDFRFLYTASEDKVLKAWTRNNLTVIHHVNLQSISSQLVADGKGNLYASDKKLRVWDVDGLLDKGFGETADTEETAIVGHTADIVRSKRNLLSDGSSRSLNEDFSASVSDVDEEFGIMNVLDTGSERNRFMKFLRERCAQESLLFWIENAKYQKLANIVSKRGLQREASKILQNFIEEGSPQEINISAEQRNELLNLDPEDFSANTFIVANNIMIELMETNFLSSYLRARHLPQYSLRKDPSNRNLN